MQREEVPTVQAAIGMECLEQVRLRPQRAEAHQDSQRMHDRQEDRDASGIGGGEGLCWCLSLQPAELHHGRFVLSLN